MSQSIKRYYNFSNWHLEWIRIRNISWCQSNRLLCSIDIRCHLVVVSNAHFSIEIKPIESMELIISLKIFNIHVQCFKYNSCFSSVRS